MEINYRVNYPIKRILVHMLEREEISLEPHTLVCILWFFIQVATYGVQQVVLAWNEHPIPGTSIKQTFISIDCCFYFYVACYFHGG